MGLMPRSFADGKKSPQTPLLRKGGRDWMSVATTIKRPWRQSQGLLIVTTPPSQGAGPSLPSETIYLKWSRYNREAPTLAFATLPILADGFRLGGCLVGGNPRSWPARPGSFDSRCQANTAASSRVGEGGKSPQPSFKKGGLFLPLLQRGIKGDFRGQAIGSWSDAIVDNRKTLPARPVSIDGAFTLEYNSNRIPGSLILRLLSLYR